MTPAGFDAAARALAADMSGADRWDELPDYLRNVWRRRAALVLRLGGRA